MAQGGACQLIQRLGHSDHSVRRAALLALGKLPPEALAPHAASLVRCLQDADWCVRSEGLAALRQLGAAAIAPHSASISRCLSDSDEYVRRAALTAMGELKPQVLAPHAPAIGNCLSDPHVAVRRAALETLEKLDVQELAPLAAEIARCLADGDRSDRLVRPAALAALRRAGPDALEAHAEAVAGCLEDPQRGVRVAALELLGRLSPLPLAPHTRGLLACLGDPDGGACEAALRALAALGLERLRPHVGLLTGCLTHGERGVREAAALLLASIAGALSPAVLAPYAEALVRLLRDTDSKVCCAALNVMGHLDATMLGAHAAAVAHCLCRRCGDGEAAVQAAALGSLRKLEPSALAAHAHAVSRCLGEEDATVRREALLTLGRLDGAFLTLQLESIVPCLGDPAEEVRREAAELLGRTDPVALTPFAPKIAQSLLDGDELVRRAALQAIGKLDSKALSRHPASIVRCLTDGDAVLRLAVPPVLAKVDPAVLGPHAAAVLRSLEVQEGETPSVRRAALDALGKLQPAALARHWHWKSVRGDTALHIAASDGHLAACQRLVLAGAPPRALNDAGNSPVDLARQGGHVEVFDFLMSRQNATTVRGGTGDALMQALADKRPVVKVDWYTMPLPGAVGRVGAVHSLVAVMVDDPGTGEASHTYVIEKAALSRGAAGSSEEHFCNGVHVSHWVDVAPNVGGRPLHSLEGSAVRRAAGDGGPLRVRALRDLAVALGPYSVATCNCHHAALAVYNACAAEGFLVPRIPNQLLTWGASLLMNAGVDVATSESGARSKLPLTFGVVASQVTSGCPQFAQFGRFPLRSSGTVMDDRWLLTSAQLAAWIYQPVPTESIVLRNGTDLEVVACVEEVRRVVRLPPGARGDFTSVGETVHVSIRRPGLLRSRTRLARLELRTGRSYTIKQTLDRKAVCEACDPLPPGIQVEHIDLSEGTNLVQWAMLTSADTIYVAFRGTYHVLDAVIDLGFMTHDEAPHGLRVHGGMWNVLHQRRHPVVSLAAERIRALRERRKGLEHVVLCGHSLGGGYAILAALDLLHRGVGVDAVTTFGAPQVVVPDRSIDLWHRLDAITTLVVNSYDVVPRLPSCLPWVFDAVPKTLLGGTAFGSVTIGCDLVEVLEQKLGRQREVMADYDTVGTLAFVGEGSRFAWRVSSSQDLGHREALGRVPEQVGTFIFQQHFVENYVSIIRGLQKRQTPVGAAPGGG